MTLHPSLTVLAVACMLAASGCAKQEAPHAAAAEHASSSAGLPSGNIANGRALATTKNATTGQACVDCHGPEGNAPIDPTYPKIGGQYADYLAHSLQAYRSGDREHALMASQAANLTDQQIADLGAYFGSVPGKLRDLHGVN